MRWMRHREPAGQTRPPKAALSEPTSAPPPVPRPPTRHGANLEARLIHTYNQAGQGVDYAALDRRLRDRLSAVSMDLAPRPQRFSGGRRTLVLSLAALLLVAGGAVAAVAHVLPDDLPPGIRNLLGDHLPLGAQLPVTHAHAGIWLVSLPCTATASRRAGETTWHVSRDCPLPYNLQPQIPASVGSQARWDVLFMIALQRYQDYWSAHPGWTAATAPHMDALARAAVSQALNDYLDGKPITIRYAPLQVVNGAESQGAERLRDAHDVERERAALPNRGAP